ncbi:MAG: hypothetical protein ACRERV_15980, partial [Methylococcales bacterium]
SRFRTDPELKGKSSAPMLRKGPSGFWQIQSSDPLKHPMKSRRVGQLTVSAGVARPFYDFYRVHQQRTHPDDKV